MRILRTSLLMVTIGVPAALASDWPALHGARRDNHSDETGLHWEWRNQPPQKVWSRDVGRGFAGVAIANDTVFLFDRIDNNERLSAFELRTGKELWTASHPTKYVDDFGFDDGPRGVPLIADQLIFTLGANGDLRTFQRSDGQLIWSVNQRETFQAPKGYFGIGAGLIVLGDNLLVNAGGKKAGIVALNVETGKTVWTATSDPASYSSPTPITLGGKPHAAFFTRSGLIVVSPGGEVIANKDWRSRLDASVNAAAPLVQGNEVFLTSSYGTGAIRLRITPGMEPEEIWSNDRSLSCHYNTPVLVGEHLYGIDGRQEGGAARLRCVSWADGRVKWSVDRFGCATLIAVDAGILAITETGELVRFDATPDRFTERSRIKVIDGVVRAAAALSNGHLLLRNETQLVALKLRK